jgi:hypothetical protein
MLGEQIAVGKVQSGEVVSVVPQALSTIDALLPFFQHSFVHSRVDAPLAYDALGYRRPRQQVLLHKQYDTRHALRLTHLEIELVLGDPSSGIQTVTASIELKANRRRKEVSGSYLGSSYSLPVAI